MDSEVTKNRCKSITFAILGGISFAFCNAIQGTMAIIYGARAITLFWIAGIIQWALFHVTNHYANFEPEASLKIYVKYDKTE